MIPAMLAKTSSLFFQPMTHIPAQTELLGFCQDMAVGTAVLFGLLGVIYLMFGWMWFKPLFTLNAAIFGAYLGALLGQRAGDWTMAGLLLGGVLSACIAWPCMKWAVAVMGGVCGAIVGASVWRMSGIDPNFAWAGGMTGLVGFGLFAFILFRGSIITYTSLQGGLMLAIGVLGLLLKYPAWGPGLLQQMAGQPLALPIAVLIPALLGHIYQQTHSSGDGGAKAGK
jgi:hypothetical protein